MHVRPRGPLCTYTHAHAHPRARTTPITHEWPPPPPHHFLCPPPDLASHLTPDYEDTPPTDPDSGCRHRHPGTKTAILPPFRCFPASPDPLPRTCRNRGWRVLMRIGPSGRGAAAAAVIRRKRAAPKHLPLSLGVCEPSGCGASGISDVDVDETTIDQSTNLPSTL